MTALAAGDALGWPIEDRGGRVGGTASLRPHWRFEEWSRREGARFNPHVQPMLPGAISDDTQLALAVARSLLRGPAWWRHLTQVELPVWTVYERGGGGATKRAAKSWLAGRAPWDSPRADDRRRYFEAGGNGTAMRCLAHCFVDEPYEQLANRLDLDSVATHGHPRALIGSRVYGWAAQWAVGRTRPLEYGELVTQVINASTLWGRAPHLPEEWQHAAAEHYEDFPVVWEQTVDETLQLLQLARQGLEQGAIANDREILEQLGAFGKASGAGHVTAVSSIYLAARYLTQPQQGLLTAAFARGADTDTLAAMTGGLLGALAEEGWLRPLDRHVQDAGTLARAVSRLLAGDREEPAAPFTTKDRTALYRFLDQAAEGDHTTLRPFGDARVADIDDLPSRGAFVRTWTLQTTEEQTILVKRIDKGIDGRPRWQSSDERDLPAEAIPASRDDCSGRSDDLGREEPRGGLVLLVGDLGRARDFYEGIAGMPVTRTTATYISFGGWLATELDDHALDPLGLVDQRRAAIRLYLTNEGIDVARAKLGDRGLHARTVEKSGKRVLCTLDPDGHPVEFHTRNGAAPPVHSQ
jgi:ADP-ribosylglycohydrolase/catechol 2,3-dioxygenase-like lactoylglutathione lyase family enzyme